MTRMPPEIVTERPGMPLWDSMCSPAAKAARAAHKAQRERIIADARAKGFRRMQGTFWNALERKLRAIGCDDPEWYLKGLRLERALEAKWEGYASAAELKLLADEEASYGD